jgi:hypothetical protein
MPAAVQTSKKESKAAPPKIAPKAESKRVAPEASHDLARTPIFLGGQPLQPGLQETFERSFGVGLGSVRVHQDTRAQSAAQNLSARAFTYGNAIFLGRNESSQDRALMGHEVAHVIQQQGTATIQKWSGSGSDHYESEAHRASAAASRGDSFQVRERTSRPTVQRLGIQDALNFFADKANMIPGFRMLTLVIGVNPVNMSRVERTTANVLRAVVELIPMGGIISQVLDRYGIFDRAATFVNEQLITLGITGDSIRAAIMAFLNSLSWTDIFHLDDVWERAKHYLGDPISRIVTFVTNLAGAFLRLIREAVLRPLAELAKNTSGWDLLKAVLGQDPITGDPVPRTAETLIGGFMKLIGKEEVWENIKKGHAAERAWAWFQTALTELIGFVQAIPSLFIQALEELEFSDFLILPSAFVKVERVFGTFALKFIDWAGAQVLKLLQIIVEVVAPGVMPYIQKAAGAFKTIIQDPIGFIGNLVRAGKQGFLQFGSNFLGHLRNSLVQWLTGTLTGAGVYIPQAFEIREIIKFVLSVLGLTWQNIRGKLVRVIGETAVHAMEVGFDLVVTLVRDGPAAAWEKIKEGISNLREMVMEQVMTFVRDRIVQAAITKLVTSLNPAGAFIQAIIAIYNTVMFFIERLQQIARVAMAFIDSIAAIAAGNISNAANRVEQTMAGLLTLVISFLARLVGLGEVSDAVVNIINRIRAPIDRALDRVIEWIVAMARKVGRFLTGESAADSDSSRAVKAAVAQEFSNKTLSTSSEEVGLVDTVWSKYQAKGLHGIKLIPARDREGMLDVIVSASLADRIAQIPYGQRTKLRTIATKMNPYAKTTTIYLSYEGASFGGAISSRAGQGHAETVFKNSYAVRLMAEIDRKRKQGKLKTPPGQPVPVVMDISRIPCLNCTEANLLAFMQGAQIFYPDTPITLTINAANLTAQGSEADLVQSIARLLQAGVEVNASTVWQALERKFKEYAAWEVRGQVYENWQFNEFQQQANEVQGLIDDALKQGGAKPVVKGSGV